MDTIDPNVTGRGPNSGSVLARRIPDAARAIGVSRATLYRLAKADKIKIVKTGGRSTISEDQLVRLAQEGAVIPAPREPINEGVVEVQTPTPRARRQGKFAKASEAAA